MNIKITPRAVLTKLLLVIAFLLFADLASVFLRDYFAYDDVYRLTQLFSFGAEKNIPTLFSSFALALCSALLLAIALTHKKRLSAWLSWLGLAAIFAFLSIDETASLHEKLTVPIRELLGTSGLLHFAWVIPYGAALMVLLLLYSRFIISLPRKTMILFIVSGATYISGAIILEMIGGMWADLHGDEGLSYALIMSFEESLEMLGVVMFVYSLLSYITGQFGELTIEVDNGTGSGAFADTRSPKTELRTIGISDTDGDSEETVEPIAAPGTKLRLPR